LLKKQKLVRNAYVFDYYLQTHKTQGIKAGRFYLKRSQSTPQIVEKLQQKPTAATNTCRITLSLLSGCAILSFVLTNKGEF
jgi:UPF0755 protein